MYTLNETLHTFLRTSSAVLTCSLLHMYLMFGIKDIQNNETNTLWPMHSLCKSYDFQVKQGILTKNQSPLPHL